MLRYLAEFVYRKKGSIVMVREEHKVQGLMRVLYLPYIPRSTSSNIDFRERFPFSAVSFSLPINVIVTRPRVAWNVPFQIPKY